jgi:predicted RND superfamily exporter protein
VLEAMLRLPIERPRATLALLALAAALAGLAHVRGAKADFGLEQLMPEDDPEFERYHALSARLGRDDAVAYVFVDDPALLAGPAGASRAIALSDALAASPFVEEVAGLATTSLLEGTDDALRLGPILERTRLADLDYPRLRERLRTDPLYAGRVLSTDGRTAAFAVRIDDAFAGEEHRAAVVAHVDSALAASVGPGTTVLVTGNPHVREGYLRRLRRDAAVFTGVVSLLLALALFAAFRSLLGVVLPLSAVLLALHFTGAFLVLSGRSLNLLSSSIPVMVLIVGVSDAIHLLTRYREELAAALPRREALERAVFATARACLLTSITTASGFFLLPSTGIPMLGDTGIVVGVGVVLAYVVTLTLLPALAMLLPPPAPLAPAGPDALLGRLAGVVMARPRAVVLVGFALLVGAALLGLPRLRVESRLLDDLPPDDPILRTRAAVEARMGGNFPLAFVVHPTPGGPGSAEQPELLAAVGSFQRALALENQGLLTRTLSPVDHLAAGWRELRGEPAGLGALPPTREAVAQVALLMDDALRRTWDPERTFLVVEARLFDRGTHATFDFLDRARRAFARTVEPRARLEVQGITYLAHRVHRDVVASSLTGFGLDFALVAVLVLVLFRSWRLAALALVPNLLPLVGTLAFMGLAGIELRLSSALVFCVVFGVAVDDTVHFLARYREERARGLGPREAAARTIATTGRAMLFLSFVLTAGFGLLLLSAFTPNRLLGLLMAVTVAFGLLGDLVLLPALLVLGDREPGGPAAPA